MARDTLSSNQETYLNCAQRFDYRASDSCRDLERAAAHLIDGSKKWHLSVEV